MSKIADISVCSIPMMSNINVEHTKHSGHQCKVCYFDARHHWCDLHQCLVLLVYPTQCQTLFACHTSVSDIVDMFHSMSDTVGMFHSMSDIIDMFHINVRHFSHVSH